MKRLGFMVDLFEKIGVGVMFVTAIYIPLFYGWKTQIEVNILWQILGLSVACTLGSVILPMEDGKEISKTSMLVRMVLYYLYINLVVLGLGFLFEWFTFRNVPQVFGMLVAIAAVFLAVYFFSYCAQCREAERMNEKLREREKQDGGENKVKK